MNHRVYLFIAFACAALLTACTGNNNTSNLAEVKNITDSNKNTDDAFRKLILGTWTTFETVRGETIVFTNDGKYSGYDGREGYEGTWEIKDHKINLSLGGLFSLDIKADTLYLDSLKYLREPPAFTEQNK